MLQHAREIAPSVSWEILVRVKRSGGMSVNELAAELKMSYMGVKQHCDDLRKQGYVDTWRRAKGTGRPEKIYRPAPKMDAVLTNWGSELCLGVLALAAQAYGEAAPDRLLYGYLQQKVERLTAKLKGKTVRDRAAELVKLRNADGWMCEMVADEQGIRILDHHSPLADVARLYPNVWEMEARALAKVFGGPIERVMSGNRSELRLPRGEEDASLHHAPPPVPMPVSAPVPTPLSPSPSEEETVEILATAEVETETGTAPEPDPAPVSEPAPVALVEELAPLPPEPIFPEPAPSAPVEPEAELEPEPQSEPELQPQPVVPPKVEVKVAPAPVPAPTPAPVLKPAAAASKAGRAVQADLFDF